jgi:hypothetical protein
MLHSTVLEIVQLLVGLVPCMHPSLHSLGHSSEDASNEIC